MMKTLFTLFFAAATIAQLGCEHSATGPEPLAPLKDPRTYTWTADTLFNPNSLQTNMRDIWASSPQDVYVVGHSPGPPNQPMYHYDGKAWKPVFLKISASYRANGFELKAIHGFAANNIWAVGELLYINPNPPPGYSIFLDSSFVMHYDGANWHDVKLIPRGRKLTSIWGSAPNDIWMGGFDGTLYHYDGTSVKRDSVPFTFPKTLGPDSYLFTTIAGSSEVVHLLLAVGKAAENYRARLYFFERRFDKWALTDSLFDMSIGQLWMSPSNILYRTGSGVHKRLGNSWQNLQLDFISSIGISGPSDDNLLVVGFTHRSGALVGQVYHYNGVDWFEFEQLRLPNVVCTDVWTDGREAFVVGHGLGLTVIIHGK